jgi:hypothetical protein
MKIQIIMRYHYSPTHGITSKIKRLIIERIWQLAFLNAPVANVK